MSCSVYIMHQKETSYFKIGIANDVEQRLGQINCVGTDVILIREYVLSDRESACKMEQALMFFLKPFHVKGEWFNVNRYILGELDDFILRFVDYESAHYWHHPRSEYFARAAEYNSHTRFLETMARKQPDYIEKIFDHSIITLELNEERYDPITILKMKRQF